MIDIGKISNLYERADILRVIPEYREIAASHMGFGSQGGQMLLCKGFRTQVFRVMLL